MTNANNCRAPTSIGLCGTGFVARGLFRFLEAAPDFEVTGILTRRALDGEIGGFPPHLLTNDPSALISRAEIVLECSGDPVHAADVLICAGRAGRKIVTLNSEAQVTIGSFLEQQGFWISEAHGDQPGCLAELHRETTEFGFRPLAYINLKGFLNPNPSREEMEYWSNRQGLSLRQVTSFTDGTKLQIEQVLVANGLGARVARCGLIGGTVSDLGDLDYLAQAALDLGEPISDYVVNPGGPPGVLILAENPIADLAAGYMPFTRLKTRKGLAYRLLRPHHLIHLEVIKTLRQAVAGHPPLITNSRNPRATVAAVAKKPMAPGHVIETALGGFDVRGVATEIAANTDAVPITLLDGAALTRPVAEGQLITTDDVELRDTAARDFYFSSLHPAGRTYRQARGFS